MREKSKAIDDNNTERIPLRTLRSKNVEKNERDDGK